MNKTWFSSDWHLGHQYARAARGFFNLAEMHAAIVEAHGCVKREDKLFVLGDVAWNEESLRWVDAILGRKELIVGNHDNLMTSTYLRHFQKVGGFMKHKGFWLSHCPIHPQEMYRARGNIHGHIHKSTATPPLPMPYFNVNVEWHGMGPIEFDEIVAKFEGWEREHEA